MRTDTKIKQLKEIVEFILLSSDGVKLMNKPEIVEIMTELSKYGENSTVGDVSIGLYIRIRNVAKVLDLLLDKETNAFLNKLYKNKETPTSKEILDTVSFIVGKQCVYGGKNSGDSVLDIINTRS